MSNIKPEVLKTLSSDSLGKINKGNKRTHMFNVDFSEYNEEFVGRITVHYPSQMEKMQMGVLRSSLLGGNVEVDVITHNLAHIISTLDIVIDEKPEWLDINNPDVEYDMLEIIYREYEDWVDSFRKPIGKNNNTDDSENGGGQATMVDTEDICSPTNGQ